jgi:hypothetical protein
MTKTNPAIWFGATVLATLLTTLSLAAWFSIDIGSAMSQTAPIMIVLAILAALTVIVLRQEAA